MKKIFLLILVLFSTVAFGQKDTLQIKLDSILKEADLLYKYEKVVWNSTDILMKKRKLKKKYGGYVVYHSNDTIYVTFIDKKQKNNIAKYSFTEANLSKPFAKDYNEMKLSKHEKELLNAKVNILNKLSDEKYNIRIPSGYDPNLVLIKENNGYKLYILMGTRESGIIPFGNDYLFKSDFQGNIYEWKKFHSRIIPAQANGPNGEKVISIFHSHLKTTPLITATDICTFRLYGELCGIKEFSVLSTALGKYFKYNLDKNEIVVTDID